MSDQSKAVETVEVPRELADRLLAAASYTSDQLVADLRACIKPRRWVFERKYAQAVYLDHNDATGLYSNSNGLSGLIPVRVTVEEIL